MNKEEQQIEQYCKLSERTANEVLIGRFMEWQLIPVNSPFVGLRNQNGAINLLNFHDIMLVVNKIESLGYEVLIGRIFCSIHNLMEQDKPIAKFVCGDINKKLETTYSTIVTFIKWYNENK